MPPEPDTSSPQPPSTDDFLIRHRLPRPLSRAYEALSFSLDAREAFHRACWCAGVTLRFLEALRLCSAISADPDLPPAAPSYHHLRAAWPEEPFPIELQDPLPGPMFRLAGIYGSPTFETAREDASDVLRRLSWLSRYRVLVVERWGFTVLLGPRIEYGVRLSHGTSFHDFYPIGTVLLLEGASGRFLSLNPILIWRKPLRSQPGRLLLLRKIDQDEGSYVEEGLPGCPHDRALIEGRCREGMLSLSAEKLHSLMSPPARFTDAMALQGTHYVHGLIWRGGTSDVFAAERLADNAPVVLKTFEYEPRVIDENWWRFTNEERFASEIQHPNVVRPLSLELGSRGTAHEQEFIRRGSLADLFETSGVIPARIATRIVSQILDALEAIHSAGIAHNDIKPDNILFDDADQAHLIDFGIASRLAAARPELRPGVPPGSPGYVAPELLAGETPSVVSDIYSAGVVLAEILTGHPPHDATQLRLTPGLPSPLIPFLERCLAPDPRVRYATAGQARQALDAIASTLTEPRAVSLDIEGTLVTNFFDRQPRLHLWEFLRFCMDRMDRVFVYTLLSSADARLLFEDLTHRAAIPPDFLGRYEYVAWPRDEGSLKDLRRCGVPIEQNAIVDDMESMIPEDQAHRWIHVQDAADLQGPDRALIGAMERLLKLHDLRP